MSSPVILTPKEPERLFIRSLLRLRHGQIQALLHRESSFLVPYSCPPPPPGHKDAELQDLEETEVPREQRNHSHLHRAFHSQREQTGLTALDGCSMQWSQKVGAGEKMVGNEREVSRWAVTGFRCCLYAEVLLLSGEPCGFISCSLAELILAMLKLAVWAGKLTLQAVLCPWPGEACCCQQH